MSTTKLTIEQLKEWIKQNKPFKIIVNPETSRIVQEAVFECGKTWPNGDKEIRWIDDKKLCFNANSLAVSWYSAKESDPEIELILKPKLTPMGCLPVIKPEPIDKWADLKAKFKSDLEEIKNIKIEIRDLYEVEEDGEWKRIYPYFNQNRNYRRHKWADLMIAWAKGAKIQTRSCSQIDWYDCFPKWLDNFEYRIKPTTVIINGVEVPTGITEKPQIGTIIYSSNTDSIDLYSYHEWHDNENFMELLNRGVFHLTKENAVLMAKAMLSFKND